MSTEINQYKPSPRELEDIATMTAYAKEHGGQFSAGDATTATGLPLLESEYAIKGMMRIYNSRLRVTEAGTLIYDFGNLERRDAITWQERFDNVIGWIWQGFKWFYKAWIAIVLVVYFVVFLVLLIAAMIAMASANKDDDRDSDSGSGMINGIFRMFWEIFQWQTFYNTTYQTEDNRGYPYRHYTPRQEILKTPGNKLDFYKSEHLKLKAKKGFVASVYDFVLGPARVSVYPFSDMQEVAAYLRTQKGLLSVAEVQALAGWTRDEAENFMTECLANLNGKADITDNATLYGEFEEVLRGKGNIGKADVVFFWEEYVPDYEVTGNTTGRNMLITAFAGFNLAMSSFVLNSGLGEILGTDSTAIMIFLGWIPFVFSITFFALPLLRWAFIGKYKKQQHIQNIRKRLMKVIFKKHKEEISLKELVKVANQWATTEEQLSNEVVQKVLEDFIYDLGGDSRLNDKAEVVYVFENLSRELTEIEELRSKKKEISGDEQIVFDTIGE